MKGILYYPRYEINFFREGIKYYRLKKYARAKIYFQKAAKSIYLKDECIKYLFKCHIELHTNKKRDIMNRDYNDEKNFKKYFSSDKFFHHMQIILNLGSLYLSFC